MNLNWDRIKDGETFQSLMNTLIIFEDHKAKIFGRKGKDAAIDARSGDGKIIFQHKSIVKNDPNEDKIYSRTAGFYFPGAYTGLKRKSAEAFPFYIRNACFSG